VKARLPTVAAAFVAVLALVETGNALLAPLRVPPPHDWDDAAADVRARLQPGDLIVFAPRWVDEVGRAHLGDVMPVEMAAHADADRYARVFEVSIRGARAPESSGARLVDDKRFGKVRVALYEKPAAAITFDFTSHAGEARVTQTLGAGAETPCFRDGGAAVGFRCATTRVEPRTLEMNFLPRRGMLVPADGARVTHLEWTEVPLGKALVLYTGIHDYISRKRGDGRVELHVFVDGREQLRATIGNDDAWRRFDIDTSAAAGTRHSVRFDVSAPSPEYRTFGFHAESRL
jgi:hypothetical protein